MKPLILLSSLFFTLSVFGQQIDTSKSFKIDSFWITPKPDFEFNSLGRMSKDTLYIVTCSEYVYSPFGLLKKESDLRKSVLKNFKSNTNDNPPLGKSYNLNTNKLTLFFDNDPYASKESYIIKGEINDSKVCFINGVKIGMKIEDFYKSFFVVFPPELEYRYNVIVYESCVTAIKHTYIFKNHQLFLVKFE